MTTRMIEAEFVGGPEDGVRKPFPDGVPTYSVIRGCTIFDYVRSSRRRDAATSTDVVVYHLHDAVPMRNGVAESDTTFLIGGE